MFGIWSAYREMNGLWLTLLLMITMIRAAIRAAAAGSMTATAGGIREVTAHIYKAPRLKLTVSGIYLTTAGYAVTGWVNDGVKWYWMHDSEAMEVNTWITDKGLSYYISYDGVWVLEW